MNVDRQHVLLVQGHHNVILLFIFGEKNHVFLLTLIEANTGESGRSFKNCNRDTSCSLATRSYVTAKNLQ